MGIEALAKSAGYGKSTMHGWERGYVAPGIIELFNWAQALGYELCVVPIGEKARKRDRNQVPDIQQQRLEGK